MVLLAIALGAVAIQPLSVDDDEGSRIEAGGSQDNGEQFAAEQAVPIDDEETSSFERFAQDQPIEDLAAAQAAEELPDQQPLELTIGAPSDQTPAAAAAEGTSDQSTSSVLAIPSPDAAGTPAPGTPAQPTPPGAAPAPPGDVAPTPGPADPGQGATPAPDPAPVATAPPTTPAPTTTEAPATTAPPPPPPPAPSSGAPGANLREIYVDGGDGYAHNPGTKEQPFRRPIEATSIAEPGTTIYFRAGTYDTSSLGALSIRRSGTPQNWIRIMPYPGERVELVSGGEYGNGFEFLGSSYVELSGFVIKGRNDSINGAGVMVKDQAHDIRVIGNQISNWGGGGVSVVGASKVTIEGNEVRDNAMRSHYQGSGISFFEPRGPVASGGNYSNIVRGNYVVHNYNAVPHRDGRITDGNCIIMDRFDPVGYQGRTLVENNVCAENGGRGVHSYRSSNITARNNTLYHNMWTSEITGGRGELTAGEGRNIVFYNNLVFNRPGIASYISNNMENTYFHNNWVASGPPPGEGNMVLPDGVTYFSSTGRGGPVTQWRPLSGSGLAGTANSDRQSSQDLTGRNRPRPGTVGALEP